MFIPVVGQRRRRRDASALVNTNPVATVVVSLADTTLEEGSTAQATAVLRDAEGAALSGRTKVWSSSDEAIATVNATGFITAVAEGGPVNITCTAEGQSDSVAVTVEDNAVATIALTPATLDLAAPSAPAADGDEPTYAAGVDTLVFSDGFDSYADVAALVASPWIVDRSSYLSLVAGRGGSGQAARSTYSEGANTGTLLTRVFAEHQLLYLTWWFRVTAGIDLTQGGLSEGPKNLEAYRVASGRLTAGVSGINLVNQQGGAKVGVEFQFRDNEMVAQLGDEIGFTQDVKVPRFDTVNDGDWHRLTYRLNNGDGMTTYALWLDGVCVRTETPPYATAADGFDELRWFDIIPGGVRAGFGFTWDIDDLVVWAPGA